jgi:hypothetical protein
MHLSQFDGNIFTFRSAQLTGSALALNSDTAYTPGSWHSLIVTLDFTSQDAKMYQDNVQVASDTTFSPSTGTYDTDLRIGNSGSTSPNDRRFKGSMAWLCIVEGIVDSTWRTNYHSNQLIDLNTNNDFLLIPFVGDWSESPTATAGFCKAS